MSRSYSIGPITGIIKPRYKVISSALGEDFDYSHIDLYIDLNTIVNALSTSTKFQNSLPFSDNVEADIISCILSVVKHWKDFFRNKSEDYRVILLVNDFEMAAMAEQKTVKSYMIPYVNKYNNDRFKQYKYYWTESMKKVEVVLRYIPNAYLIRCDRIDSFIVPNILDDYKTNGRSRIIVTGSSLMTNYCYMDNTKVLYSRYKPSIGIQHLSEPLMIVQAIAKIDDQVMEAFIKNNVFYNLLNAIIGDFDRGIIGLTQVTLSSFAVDLIRGIEKNEIPDNPKSIESIFPVMDNSYHDYLRQVYPLIDIERHSGLIPSSLIEKTKSLLIDLYDIDSLRSLSVNGLNLLELL